MTNKLLIAIVDDDKPVREGIASLMRSSGFLATTFGSARSFLDRRGKLRVDLLITDFQMPVMNGLELLQRLRLDGNLLPVIIVTAFARPEIAEAARSSGALAFLRKPFDENAILSLIETALK